MNINKLRIMNPELKELFDALYLSTSGMTAGQVDFIESCKKQYRKSGTISERQMTVLIDIKKHSHPVQRVSMHIN